MVYVQTRHPFDARRRLFVFAVNADRLDEFGIVEVLFHGLRPHPVGARRLETGLSAVAPLESGVVITLVEAEKVGRGVKVANRLVALRLLCAGIEGVALLEELREVQL